MHGWFEINKILMVLFYTRAKNTKLQNIGLVASIDIATLLLDQENDILVHSKVSEFEKYFISFQLCSNYGFSHFLFKKQFSHNTLWNSQVEIEEINYVFKYNWFNHVEDVSASSITVVEKYLR